MSEKRSTAGHRGVPSSQAFHDFISSGWSPRDERLPSLSEAARFAAPRRETLSAAFPGDRLVVPAGGLKVRSNDTDYVFRPHTAFAHLTGLGSDREPDAVLLFEPLLGEGHEVTLFFRPPAPRDSAEFFADSRFGEFWVGSRPTLEALSAELGLLTRHLDDFEAALQGTDGDIAVRVVRDADADVTRLVDDLRRAGTVATPSAPDPETEGEAPEHPGDLLLARTLSTMRLVKDEWEIDEMREACRSTARAFTAVVADLPQAVKRGRGERWVEGVFGLHARHQGNGVGYDSICAAGDHANTLHWIKNTGDLDEDDLLLIDAGVEVDSLFTADVTRTLPICGQFTDAQRKVYDAVYEAQCAGIEACRPGGTFKDVHAAAIRVIAQHLFDWGLLPDGVTVEATLEKDGGQYHRRWMVHGTSHHLGLDVHDCQLALRSDYMEGTLRPGMLLTVEPGLYFKADDELVPQELRGIGVRIEDDVLITADGHENLTAMLPRSSRDVEMWMAQILE